MTTQPIATPGELAAPTGAPRVKARDSVPKGRWFQEVGWRHLVGIVACIWALFPISYIVSAALNPLGNVVTTSAIPKTFSGENFSKLFNTPSIQFERWYL